MDTIKNMAWLFINVISLSALIIGFPSGNLQDVGIPDGFFFVTSAPGVNLYQKDYLGGNPDYVQVVNLSQGASVKLFQGNITDLGTSQGVYGGDNPKIVKQSIQEAWNSFSSTYPKAFCITNGQFFSTNDDPTNLAFPLKVDGNIVSDGYGITEFRGQKLILEIWNDRADISTLTKDALHSSTAPNIIAGLTEDADKGLTNYVGRTFIGIDDSDQDGTYEIILIFNSKTARQEDAVDVLRAFGADKVIMLDGGESTQLICNNTPYINTNRIIPQAIGVVASESSTSSVTVLSSPSWPILIEGESFSYEIQIRNTGSEVWRAGQYQLVNQKNGWGSEDVLLLYGDVSPGETVTFTINTDGFSQWGIFSSEWYLANGDEKVSDTFQINVIVMPDTLEKQKKELERKVKQWVDEQIEDIEQLIIAWIQEQVEETIFSFCNSTILLFPMVVFGYSKYRKRPRI
ncbi:MAG: hypothetical protein E3J88_05755 [Anaerolineales bacterium]|nr:MAG: hypothetical protein E3J88_05755 [Anaerolineales bacterium]